MECMGCADASETMSSHNDDNADVHSSRWLRKHITTPAPSPPPTSTAPSTAPTSAPSSAPSIDPQHNQTSSHSDKNINNLSGGSNFGWIVWFCLALLGSFFLYKCYRFWLRRRRIILSEQAGNMLGDLQMIPSGDFSDSDHHDDGYDDDHHDDDFKDQHGDHDDGNDDHDQLPSIQII